METGEATNPDIQVNKRALSSRSWLDEPVDHVLSRLTWKWRTQRGSCSHLYKYLQGDSGRVHGRFGKEKQTTEIF